MHFAASEKNHVSKYHVIFVAEAHIPMVQEAVCFFIREFYGH